MNTAELQSAHPGPEVRAVVFDMDGVLTDSEPLINEAAIAMFREKGLQVQPEDFRPFIGTGEERYIGGVAEKYQFPLELPAAKKRTYELYLELVPQKLRAFQGAGELVRACRAAGLKVAVASSADAVKVAANLRQIGLPVETWDAVVTGEAVTAKKPAPDIFLSAAAQLGLAPAQCVVVEDAVNGVEAAKAAGMRCVAVAQSFSASDLARADLVRSGIGAITVGDLRAQVAEPPLAVVPPVAGCEAPVIAPWGFWATLGLGLLMLVGYVGTQALAMVALAVFASVVGPAYLPRHWENSGLALAFSSSASAPVVVGLAWVFASIKMPAREYLGLRWVTPSSAAKWLLYMALFIVGSDLLTWGLGKPIVPDFMRDIYRSAGFPPLLWLALMVAAPVTEETLFRGFLFKGLRHSRLGATGAILLTSLAWASIHVQYDLYGIASVFASGLLLGLARLRTGSLYLPMVLHGFMNLVATVETVWVLRRGGF